MPQLKITKRNVDALRPAERRVYYYDTELTGFGIAIMPSGAKSYFAEWRAGHGRGAPMRRVGIKSDAALTPEEARSLARDILRQAERARRGQGDDPAAARAAEKAMPTVAELADAFVADHLRLKRKASTADWAELLLNRFVKPHLGGMKADRFGPSDVARLHKAMRKTPYQANRTLAVIASMYSWAATQKVIRKGFNPTEDIERYPEAGRERYLTVEELERLGAALHEAETVGLEWQPDTRKATSKHAPAAEKRRTRMDPYAAAAIRLLLLTGARLREILHLEWSHVDMERGLLLLPDSKTGKKAIVLNAPALTVLSELPRADEFVIVGGRPGQPRTDLKRPWAAISRRAGLHGVRLHDLRHSFASFGAGAGLGLPLIGRLLGHTNSRTTAKYAHLDADPVRKASETIALRIADALRLAPTQGESNVVPITSKAL